jgi:tRNA-splicing ligase RtcB
MSRSAAKRNLKGRDVARSLEARGITVRSGNLPGLAEEAPQAYKDASTVVEVTQSTGISRIVAKTRPIGVVKG